MTHHSFNFGNDPIACPSKHVVREIGMDVITAQQTDPADLSAVLKGSREDRRQVFTELYQLHAGPLQAYLLRLTCCVHQAEDLTQETFLRAMDKIDRFEGKSSFKTWLYSIATNLYRDQRRKEATIMAHKSEVESALIAADRSTEDASREEAIQNLRQALQNLPEDLRAPVVLVCLEGLKYAEAAEVLGISLDALRMRIHRGHLELVKVLRGR